MPPLPQRAFAAIQRFPAKSLVATLLAVVVWEGGLKKTEALPAGYLAVLGVSFILLFFDRSMPLRFGLGIVIISLAVRECYPFSHFPMYDRFTDHSFYVYVADGDDQPVPLQNVTGIRTSRLKKPYDKALDKKRKALGKRKRELTPDDCRLAGEESLARLYADASPEIRKRLEAMSPLRLYHVNLLMGGSDIDERPPMLVAELKLPPK